MEFKSKSKSKSRITLTALLMIVVLIVLQSPVMVFGQQISSNGGSGGGGGTPTGAAFTAVTDASPITWALANSFVVNGIITLAHTTGTRALNLTGPTSGGYYTLVIKQDSTGGAAMTLGTGCTWKVGGGGSGTITLTSAANAIDVLAFTYDGTNCYANFQTNFN